MVLQRLYPVSSARRIDAFERFWRGFGLRPYVYGNGYSRTLPLDVQETDDAIKVSASVPGIDPENIDVTVDEGVLTLRAATASAGEEWTFPSGRWTGGRRGRLTTNGRKRPTSETFRLCFGTVTAVVLRRLDAAADDNLVLLARPWINHHSS